MNEYYGVGKNYSSTRSTGKTEEAPVPSEPVRVASVGNVASYLSAEASLHLHGPVSNETFAARKALCVSCPSRVLSDQLPDEIGFCRSCGCGVSERAKLTVKLTMPTATCPLGKWGAAEGRHPKVIDRLKSWAATRLLGK